MANSIVHVLLLCSLFSLSLGDREICRKNLDAFAEGPRGQCYRKEVVKTRKIVVSMSLHSVFNYSCLTVSKIELKLQATQSSD